MVEVRAGDSFHIMAKDLLRLLNCSTISHEVYCKWKKHLMYNYKQENITNVLVLFDKQ